MRRNGRHAGTDLPDIILDDGVELEELPPHPAAEAPAAEDGLVGEDVLEEGPPEVAAGLAEDSVRLYLREIGEVGLLDADSEFRLATLIEAKRQLIAFRQRPVRKGTGMATAAYRNLLRELATSWQRFGEDARQLKREVPDLARMLSEAQALHHGWQHEGPSYLRGFLASGLWGHDPLWNSMVRKAYAVYLCLYLLTAQYAEWLAQRKDGCG
jgi:RNA polymerase primary sigma factor